MRCTSTDLRPLVVHIEHQIERYSDTGTRYTAHAMPDSNFCSATRYASETDSSNNTRDPPMLSFTNPTNPDIRMAVALLLAIASSSTLERKQLREDTLISFDSWARLQVEIGWSHQFDEVIKGLFG